MYSNSDAATAAVNSTATAAVNSTATTGTFIRNGIMNDSSFASVSGPDGGMYVFFQDNNGSLRQAVYSKPLSLWNTDIDQIIPGTSEAKEYTLVNVNVQGVEVQFDI